MSDDNLQDRYAPGNACFGCGPSNPRGLRIKSRVVGDEVQCEFRPEPWQEAFTGMLSGGITGTILDCHMNWTAAHHLMIRTSADAPPCTVTAEFTVKLLAPTPSTGTVLLRARVVDSSNRRANVTATVEADGVVTATGSGVFVAVKEGHPAWHRW